MFLSDFAIKKPVTTIMMMSALLVFGVIGFLRLGVDQFPKADFPIVTITTVYEGAGPEVVEENVTDVVEEEVATIEGVRNLTSVSSHGASVVTIEFDMSRDIDLAAQDVRDRIAGAAKKLPLDADPPVINKLDMQAQPIMWVAVSGKRPIEQVTAFAEDVMKLRLETLKGVGAIVVGGRRERTVRVWLDRDRLEARGVTAADVVRALGRENVEVPGGWLKSKDVEFSVKIEGEFTDVGSFNELIINKTTGTGTTTASCYHVRLRDVGFVEDGLEDERSLARYNGEAAVGLGIRKKSGANTVELAGLIKKELDLARPDLPEGLKLDVAFDSSVFITESMSEMQFALVFGGLLTALIVFLFLRSLSATFITAVTIPLSIIGTFVFIYFLGFTLNTMTMLALTLAIGIVIDDAIVIIDNIHRHGRHQGATDSADAGSDSGVSIEHNSRGSLIAAARSGTQEIAFAVIATTLTLAAVFIPVAFMKGVIGRFFFEFGITVSVAVFLSTFIALTFTPMMASRFMKVDAGATKQHGRFYNVMENIYSTLESFYSRSLSRALDHRLLVVVIALFVFGSSLLVWNMLGKEFMPPEDQSRFFVSFSTPEGSSIDYTEKKLAYNESVLKNTPEIRSFFGAIGLGDSGSVNKGIMFVRMHPKHERKRSQSEVIGALRGAFGAEPGQRAFPMALASGFGAGRGAPLQFIIKGPSIGELKKYSDLIAERFSKVPGIVDVDTDFDLGLPELKVYIDRDRAADLGVDTTTVAETINTLIGGRDVTTFKQGGKRYDVRVKLISSQRSLPSDIERLFIRNSEGRPVKLSSVVEVAEGVGPSVINRKDRERSITVTANMEPGKPLGSAITDITDIAREVLPDGYTTKLGGSADMFKESIISMLVAFLLAVIVTYMVLASQFESLLHPFTVMLALPLSIAGALFALWVSGSTVNIYSLIGLTLLIGLVTKNSILLIDYTNILRSRGHEVRSAVLNAGPVRLRPILMTAMSTICGVLPTAIGIGPGSESRAPMAIAVIGGLLVSTLLTLFVVPVVYTLLDDLKNALTSRFI